MWRKVHIYQIRSHSQLSSNPDSATYWLSDIEKSIHLSQSLFLHLQNGIIQVEVPGDLVLQPSLKIRPLETTSSWKQHVTPMISPPVWNGFFTWLPGLHPLLTVSILTLNLNYLSNSIKRQSIRMDEIARSKYKRPSRNIHYFKHKETSQLKVRVEKEILC